MENNFKVGDNVHVKEDSNIMKVNSINGDMIDCLLIKGDSIQILSINYQLLEKYNVDNSNIFAYKKTQFD